MEQYANYWNPPYLELVVVELIAVAVVELVEAEDTLALIAPEEVEVVEVAAAVAEDNTAEVVVVEVEEVVVVAEVETVLEAALAVVLEVRWVVGSYKEQSTTPYLHQRSSVDLM